MARMGDTGASPFAAAVMARATAIQCTGATSKACFDPSNAARGVLAQRRWPRHHGDGKVHDVGGDGHRGQVRAVPMSDSVAVPVQRALLFHSRVQWWRSAPRAARVRARVQRSIPHFAIIRSELP